MIRFENDSARELYENLAQFEPITPAIIAKMRLIAECYYLALTAAEDVRESGLQCEQGTGSRKCNPSLVIFKEMCMLGMRCAG